MWGERTDEALYQGVHSIKDINTVLKTRAANLVLFSVLTDWPCKSKLKVRRRLKVTGEQWLKCHFCHELSRWPSRWRPVSGFISSVGIIILIYHTGILWGYPRSCKQLIWQWLCMPLSQLTWKNSMHSLWVCLCDTLRKFKWGKMLLQVFRLGPIFWEMLPHYFGYLAEYWSVQLSIVVVTLKALNSLGEGYLKDSFLLALYRNLSLIRFSQRKLSAGPPFSEGPLWVMHERYFPGWSLGGVTPCPGILVGLPI